jgi:hypothetical protein
LDDDFEFIVGKLKHRCSHIVAAFLSPKIARLISNDPTISCYSVSAKDNSEYFESFIGLRRGFGVDLNDSNEAFFTSLSLELENFELFWLIEHHFRGESLSTENAISRYLIDRMFGSDSSKSASFIAPRLSEFSKESLRKFAFSDFDQILSNPSLCIESEDWLFDFICDLGCDENIDLFAYVEFENLSVDRVVKFCEKSGEMDISLSSRVWKSVCGRLVLPVVRPTSDSTRYSTRIEFKGSNPISGIISHLTRQCGGNVCDKGVVGITTSGNIDDTTLGKYAAEFTDDPKYWHSIGAENQWLCYDFKNMRIRPTHYSIRSRPDNSAWVHAPRNWFVEVSNDGSNWTQIDEHQNDGSLAGVNVTRTFTVSEPDYCRYVRIRHTGMTSSTYRYVVINAFELFGLLKE